MSYQTLETELAPGGVALIWLNRPEVRNAMSDVLIAELTDAFECAIEDDDVRAIVLGGRGSAFCAGADLNWLKRAKEMSAEEAFEDSLRLARLLRTIHDSPKPVLARVQGAAFAGGLGLVAACDIAVASLEAKFCLSEVRLGLIPAMISPYVIAAIGEARARRWFLTAEVFEAAEAWRVGLIDEVTPPDELDTATATMLGHLLKGGPLALRESKRLIRDVAGRPIDDALGDETARRIAVVRSSAEGQEGIASFFEKRKPSWVSAHGAQSSSAQGSGSGSAQGSDPASAPAAAEGAATPPPPSQSGAETR